ncbi:cation:proton antiporter [Dysgonomonas sp. 25]|uniref:cation:proton antiporter n=1 Tax=Dysgonomonas sp. 25 TaxID=2302933 RepID=UPI0013CFF84D|nr:cation:proton antiporter [Dysgonomonas sp. 25]NDV69509.1 sodium:proton antiporter [Dysgonomonas sp. 25]
MAHLPNFIIDLAVILISAGIVTILFKWLKQPVVLGYIVAGLLASPHISFLPTVTDTANIHVWSEIGIIFLLFALGLEFSFKKLVSVGGTASIATVINMGSMIVIGYIIGKLLGWGFMDSIFLGGMLSMSSTTIIIKAFTDMNLQKKKFAGIVFGMLIVEDLAAILMMVLLSTLAVSQKFEGSELVEEMLKLVFFILIWFVVGIYLIPTLLKKLKKHLNDETLLIVAVGLCLGMVLFASAVGFSAALGAFIMGSILAETIEAKHIEHLVEPLKNLFGAVFFVSVGMMIDPDIIVKYAGLIILLTVVILIGRPIFAALGVVASGQGTKVAVQSGFSLAQIGEFSFIIATLGMSLKVIREDMYPIIVAVSVITTFTTPYFIKVSDPIASWVDKKLPNKWNRLRSGYANSYKSVNKQNTWKKLLKSILLNVAVYFTISIAIMLLFQRFITPFIIDFIPNIWGKVLAATLTLLLMAPMMRAIIMKRNKSQDFKNLWSDNYFNRGALVSLIVLRVAICVALTLMVLIPLFPTATPILGIIALVFLTIITFSQAFKKQSRMIENRFIQNLNSKQQYDESLAAIPSQVANDLLSKDIHIEEVEISPLSNVIGKSLRELNFKQRTGVNIICVIRGERKINIPDGKEILYPYDRIVIAGSDEEIQSFTTSLEERNKALEEKEEESATYHISLSQYIVEKGSAMIGKSIIKLNIRDKTECMIIGIDRNDESITNFDARFIFQEGDILWLAGEKEMLNAFGDNIEAATENTPTMEFPI